MSARRPCRQSGITLIELLVAMTITTILSAMIVSSWIYLTRSFARTTITAEQIDIARDGTSRMERELRDVQRPLPGQGWPEAIYMNNGAIRQANCRRVEFFTTFNEADNSNPLSSPVLVRYSLNADGTLVRYESRDKNLSFSDTVDERQIVTHVVNEREDHQKAVFIYTYVDPLTGELKETGNPGQSVLPIAVPTLALTEIKMIRIDVLVDLNPGGSPEYTEFVTSIQPRNLRDT